LPAGEKDIDRNHWKHRRLKLPGSQRHWWSIEISKRSKEKIADFVFFYDAHSIAMKGMESWTHDNQD
jgi:hypothetical protein